MPFGLRKMFFGPKNTGPLESRTTAYAHKNSPIVNTAKQIGLTTEFNFQSNPWTVTYTGTPTQFGQLLQMYPSALQMGPSPMNTTRKANNRPAVAARKTRSRKTRSRKTRSQRRR